ncbi:MAG: hypothetical protein ACYS9X_26195 [Planctomycetota bacterium]
MKRSSLIGIGLALAALAQIPVHAWLRKRLEDAVVVERSQVIVVGRLKRGSIEYVPHKRKPNEGASWEHHAILIVSEVLKGTLDEREIPIIIHYGLTPVVGGYVKRDSFTLDCRGSRKDYPKDVIEIVDTGSHNDTPFLSDADKDNLWFLRRLAGIYGEKPGTGDFGIEDPKDVQPLALKDYFLAYLSEDPEKAVREYVANRPKLAKRAETYLDHPEIERILKTADPKTRAERLLPHYAKRHWWRGRSEAKEAIMACGEVAAPCLRKLFVDPADLDMRADVIWIWGDLRYDGCVDLLIDLLEKHDRFLGEQELRKDWWKFGAGSELGRRCRAIRTETRAATGALGQIGDPRAREVIELTKRRSQTFADLHMVRSCDWALAELDKKARSRYVRIGILVAGVALVVLVLVVAARIRKGAMLRAVGLRRRRTDSEPGDGAGRGAQNGASSRDGDGERQ